MPLPERSPSLPDERDSDPAGALPELITLDETYRQEFSRIEAILRGAGLDAAALEQKLPRKYWLEINRVMVPFGKFVCTGKLPKCSTCPVLRFCRQVGVTSHR